MFLRAIFELKNSSGAEIININSSNSMKFVESLPELEISTEASTFSNLQAYDLDLNMANLNDCKYYTVNEFHKLKLQKKFNIFHSNVNGLESKFDNLHEFLSSASFNMDIVAITETSQKTNENFIKNVSIEAYDIYSTGSQLARGGTVIYVNKNFDSFERNDLKINNEE